MKTSSIRPLIIEIKAQTSLQPLESTKSDLVKLNENMSRNEHMAKSINRINYIPIVIIIKSLFRRKKKSGKQSRP